MSDIIYARDQGLTVDEYVDVVGNSELGATRPIGDRERVAKMIAGANLVVTARLDGRCIGLSRCVTDFAWTAYCCDLAVHRDFQGRGVGRELVTVSKLLLGDDVGLALFSMPGAVPFYDRLEPLGMKRNQDGYFWTRTRGV